MRRLTLYVAILFLALPALAAPRRAGKADGGTISEISACNTGSKGEIFTVDDGANKGDCTTGGGSEIVECFCDGSAWVAKASVLRLEDLVTDLNCTGLTNGGLLVADGSGVACDDDDGGAGGGGDNITVGGAAASDANFVSTGDVTFTLNTTPTPDEVSANVTDDSHAHTGTTISALDAGDTTTGTFADARISESSVTQHQAALSITESQVSDLVHTTDTTCSSAACAVGTDDTVTLVSSAAPTPTAEGRLEWDSDDNRLVVGDGATAVTFHSGAHTAAFTPNADPGVDHSSYVAGHGDGANCSSGNYPLGMDAAGAAQNCTPDDDIPEAADYTNLTAGRSLTAPSAGTIDADVELYERTKCLNVDPTHTTTDWLFFRAERAITVTGIDCIAAAATSVVMTLRECDGNGGTCGATEAAMTCGTTNTTESGGIDDAAVDAGDWMRVLRGTVSGTPGQVNLCVTYTVND